MSELGIKSQELRKRGIIYDRNRTTATLAHSCAALQKRERRDSELATQNSALLPRGA